MNIFKFKLRQTLSNRALNQAIEEAKPENLEPGMKVTLIDDTSRVYEIQAIKSIMATLALFENNQVYKEITVTKPLCELICVNDIFMYYEFYLDEFNQSQEKKMCLKQ